MALLERLTAEELEICEALVDPICASECLFSDLDNLSRFKEEFAHIRLGQFSMLSFEYIIDDDPSLTIKENFKLLEGAGNIYNFGARKYGKSLITLILDILLSVIHLDGWKTIFSSYDAVHIRSVLERIIPITENHPIFKIFDVHTKRSPTYLLQFRNEFTIESVNQNIMSKNPGAQFFGHHAKKIWLEEASFEAEKVYEKRIEATSEVGCIERMCIAEKSKILLANFMTKNIEDIEIGDKILAWNDKTRRLEETTVLNKFDSGIRNVVKLKNDRNELWLTPEHKIRSKIKKHYAWRRTDDVKIKDCYADALSYIDNELDYYKGVLIGLIDSDGSCCIIKGKTQICYQYSLCQSDEVEFFRYVLNYLNINYSEDVHTEQRPGTFTNKEHPIYCFRIKREYNSFIQNIYSLLEINKDIQSGYLAGFVIGDGWIEKKRCSFIINQDYDCNKTKIYRIISIANKLCLPYSHHKKLRNSNWSIYFPKYSIVLPINSKKGFKYKELLLSKERYLHNALELTIDEEKENVQVYDIETNLHSFIANGFIVHNSGMTNFTKYSPIGKIFYDLAKKPWIVNLPQYVSPMWDEKEKQKAARKYGGEGSVGFKVFVKGEVIEDGIAVLDMERVRRCYMDDKEIKTIEIDKNSFHIFEQRLIVEAPKNAGNVYIAADIGESAPTEIAIFAEINKKYRYIYNVILRNLTDKQQYKVFKYIAQRVGANFIGLDTTEGTGRAIFRSLAEDFDKDHLIWCFTPETDILTNVGWKTFQELNKNDKVLTLNPQTNQSYYTDIVSFFERNYDGEIIDYDAERLKFQVTPDHNCYFRPHTMTSKMIFDKAKNLKGGESFKRDLGHFIGSNVEEIEISGQFYSKNKILKFKSKDFLEFLGWYLSEGSIYDTTITIYQSKLKNKIKYEEIVNCIRILGFTPSLNKNSVSFSCAILANWLKCNCYINDRIKYKTIYNCYNKKIPNHIKNFSSHFLKHLIKTLWLGDGWISCVGQEGFCTSSKQLADDVQEIVLKTGLVATIKIGQPQLRKFSKSLNKEMNCSNNYVVLICKNKNSTIQKSKLSRKNYRGKVYDIEVQPSHLIYVRYKGKSFWSGNCSFNEKIPVEFEKDEHNAVIMKDGKPVYKEEYVSEWSIQHLKDLFYEERIELPLDYKLDSQLNSVVAMQSGNRTTYKCISEEDHAFQSLQVFAIMAWDTEFRIVKPIIKKNYFKSGLGF
jgi:hypothetical protein